MDHKRIEEIQQGVRCRQFGSVRVVVEEPVGDNDWSYAIQLLGVSQGAQEVHTRLRQALGNQLTYVAETLARVWDEAGQAGVASYFELYPDFHPKTKAKILGVFGL